MKILEMPKFTPTGYIKFLKTNKTKKLIKMSCKFGVQNNILLPVASECESVRKEEERYCCHYYIGHQLSSYSLFQKNEGNKFPC